MRTRTGQTATTRLVAATLTLVVTAAATPRAARAEGPAGVSTLQTPGAATQARPWASGISATRQQAALERLQEGNLLLKEALFRQAAEKYDEALKEWDHPGVHYNMALALLNLDQPLKVHAHLLAAIKFGEAP